MLAARICKNFEQKNRFGSGAQGKSSRYQALKSIKRFEFKCYFEFYIQHKNIIFQYYYQSYCDYLLKMGRIDKIQAVFEQSTLSDFEK